jgi:hypothetical protein
MTRDTWRQERQFGVTIGLALAVLSGWLFWRGFAPAATVPLAGVGALLVALGAGYPRALVYPNRAWMAFSEALSWVVTRVILAVLFYLVFAPLGGWRRARGWDPLNRRAPADRKSFWQPYSDRQADARHYEKMF